MLVEVVMDSLEVWENLIHPEDASLPTRFRFLRIFYQTK